MNSEMYFVFCFHGESLMKGDLMKDYLEINLREIQKEELTMREIETR